MYSVVRRGLSKDASSCVLDNVTLAFNIYATYLLAGTPLGGQFVWGGTPLKEYQWRPMVGSTGSEIRCRVQGQKPA